jgi:hypothetical protein
MKTLKKGYTQQELKLFFREALRSGQKIRRTAEGDWVTCDQPAQPAPKTLWHRLRDFFRKPQA